MVRLSTATIVNMSMFLLSMARPGRAALATAFGRSLHTARQQTSIQHVVTSTAGAANRQSSSISSAKKLGNDGIWKTSGRTFSSSSLYMSAADSDDDSNDSEAPSKTLESEWDIKGLKQEVSRLTMRSHKKVGKASTRLRKAQELVDQLTADDNATMEQLEACPNNLEALELEWTEQQTRLQKLNQLNDLLVPMKSTSAAIVLPPDVAQLAVDLGVDDQPPQRPARGPKKQKGPRTKNPAKTRLPYRRFYTVDNTEIRVRPYVFVCVCLCDCATVTVQVCCGSML